MTEQTPLETELAVLLVTSLELEDVEAADIDPEAPLFGTDPAGLGLDSIDALEIALAVHQQFGVALHADDEETNQVFRTLRSLADHIESARAET